jgi:hypothetical protein
VQGIGDGARLSAGRYASSMRSPPMRAFNSSGAGLAVEQVRPVRDEIERRVRQLLDELGVPSTV